MLLLILLTFLLGFFIALLFNKSLSFGEKVFLSYPLGLGSITLLSFVMGLLQAPLVPSKILASVLSIILVLFFLVKKELRLNLINSVKLIKSVLKTPIFADPRTVANAILLLIPLGVVAWSLMVNLIQPPVDWDTISLYDYRAKLIADNHSLAQGDFTYGTREQIAYNYSYPLFTSMAHALVYIFQGENPMIVYSLIYLSLLGSMYFLIKKNSSVLWASIFLAVFSLDPMFSSHAKVAYTNLPYGLFLGLGTIYALEWIKKTDIKLLILSAILVGMAVWVRQQEPFWIGTLALIIICAFFKKKYLHVPIFFGIVTLIKEPWVIYMKNVFGNLQNTGFHLLSTYLYLDVSKLIPSFIYSINNFVISNHLSALLLILSTLVVVLSGKVKKYMWELLVIILFIGIMFLGTYYFSLNFKWWNMIPDSLVRLSMFFHVVVYYVSAKVLYALGRRKRS